MSQENGQLSRRALTIGGISAVAHVKHPHVLRIKIRAAPEAKLDWGYDVACSRRRHGAISGQVAESSEHHPPVVARCSRPSGIRTPAG